ncbi:uncharacterized protein DDB_G0283697 isoform X2 [Ooceraea biroi]|uniref:uncharacterized protein DDB_G0283697 isoform X2 n=1 Tax=Ooceraea biroi TaxID=2015173 RepID=UPI000F09907F|nr:uncharacterized protein DDB_G0283697 isoform X2 [Ooceraea biroi]
MPRSTRDSDDDSELKVDHIRSLATQTVNSPSLRRSSRIKQNTPSVSPGSDTSSVNNQPVRVTRKRATTLDSVSLDVLKEQRSRRVSMSSYASKTMDIGTPTKRITRSTAATSSNTTPTKMTLRASKCFVRAGSETKSPSPAVRSTRRTRSSSVEPESLTDQTKSQPNTPVKVRRRASVLPANSPVKEEVEEYLIPYVRLDLTIPEIEEPTNSDKAPKLAENNSEVHNNSTNSGASKKRNSIRNLDSSLDKLSFSPESQSATETRKDKATSSSSSVILSSDEAFDLPEKSELFNKSNSNMNVTMENKENLGDSNYLPDIASQSQTSQKISKKRRSINKDNNEGDDSLCQEKKFDHSDNKSEIHNASVDKTVHDKNSLAIPSEVSMDNLTASENDGNNDVKLALIGRNSCLRDAAEDVITLDRSAKSSVDLQASPSVNEKSNDRSVAKESAQNDETVDVDREQEQKNVSEFVKELESSNVAQMVQSTSSVSNTNKAVIQNNESSDFTNIAERLATEKESIKRDIKQNNIHESSDDLETKNNSHVSEKTREDEILIVDSDPESDIDINLISEEADEQEEKTTKKNNSADETSQECSQSIEKEIDVSQEKSDRNGMEISQEGRSLSKSRNQDTTEERSEKKKKKKSLSNRDDSKIEEQACLNRSTEKELKAFANLLENVFDDESSDSETIIPAMDLGFENCSTVAHAGSIANDSDGSEKLNDTSNSNIVSSFLFAEADNDEDNDNDTDKDSSVNSDVRKEYNLDGTEQKFDDDDVPHDECRASESEYSDPNDNGSDLADFIVDDDQVENEKNEEKEEGDSDEEQDKNLEEQKEMNDEDNQSEEEGESGEEEKKIDTKNKEQKKTRAKVNEHVMIENEDAEQSEVKIDSCDSSDESSDDNNELPEKIGENKKNDSVEIISSRINETKKEQITDPKKSCAMKNEETILLDTSDPNVSVFDKSKKTHVAKREETISLISSESPSSIKIKRKSLLRCSETKVETEQDSLKLDESAKSRFSRKLSKLHSPMDCSTPKLNSSKHKLEFNIETPKTVEKTRESKVELDKSQTNTSSKKSKSKDSTTKKNTSLTDTFHQDKRFVERPLNTSLPSDLREIIEKANLSKPTVSKTAELHKSMSVTHTETPRIRHLGKEKLNKSAPVSKLHVEVDQSKESKDELPTTEEKAVAKTKIKEKSKENVSNVDSFSDNTTRKRKRERKHKKQAEETLNENITDKVLSEDIMELEASRNQKRVKFSESLTVKDDSCKGTSEINETKKEKKKKKKLVNVSEQRENIKEADTYQNKKNETELEEQQQEQEVAQNEETSPEKLSTKKRKKKKIQKNEQEVSLLETKISKTKSKNSDSDKPQAQADESNTIDSINAFAKARCKMQEAIRATEMRIKANQELKEKKMLEIKEKKMLEIKEKERALQLQKQEQRDAKISRKRKKEAAEERGAFAPSSTGCMQRLPDDVIKNLSDVPTRATKRRRRLLHESPITSPQPQNSKSKAKKASHIGVQLSSSGSTTQFTVINLQKLKKQPPKESAAVASFRQRMLDRNKREPVSAYLMYLEKQKASSNNYSSNAV